MKKILSLILGFLLIACFVSCKNDEKQKNGGIDIEYYVNLGQIPETEITLGTSPEAAEEILSDTETDAESDEHGGYNIIEGENNVLIEAPMYDYYYKKATPEVGIGYIVSYTEAFGFEMGEIITEMENALKKYDVKRENANENNAFFYIGDYGTAQILRIKFNKNSVLFLFDNNALCATAIYNNNF